VVQEGNAEKAAQIGNPDLAFDRLGPELGSDTGTATRYRMFYVIDRSKAIGFNPGIRTIFGTSSPTKNA